MDIDHKHRFDGKEDRNYHQKPFDDNTDRLPQIDEDSATLAERRPHDVPFGDPDGAGKGQPVDPQQARAGHSGTPAIDDDARLTQYPDGNSEG